jgi:hypothetical protein
MSYRKIVADLDAFEKEVGDEKERAISRKRRVIRELKELAIQNKVSLDFADFDSQHNIVVDVSVPLQKTAKSWEDVFRSAIHIKNKCDMNDMGRVSVTAYFASGEDIHVIL